MKTPNDLDAMLQAILKDAPIHGKSLTLNDRVFIGKLIESVDNGRRAVMMVESEDGSIDYMIANTTRLCGIELMAKMMRNTALYLSKEAGE